ncbi:hypothetical protein IWW34DRAFT_605088 [Fusarium oxysporum f. sp. albedinis]|nr:hypothetical protein IWW34DRAFT_605088 [Fusarium oxysporum f. sp. albedinis]
MLNKFIDVRDRDSYSTFTSATGVSILTSFLTEETDDMRKGTRPPPLNLSIVTRPRSLPRLSTTPIARELTPLLTPLPEEVEEPTGAAIRAVRVAVDFMQIVSCLLVILMLAIFFISYSGAAVSSHGIKAFILIAALTCDVGLGMWSIVHHDRPWTGPAVLLRTLTASVLLGSLVSFLAVERVFPSDYTYWGLPLSQTGAPVLGLVSAILGWDLVHVVLSRRTVECWALLQGRQGEQMIDFMLFHYSQQRKYRSMASQTLQVNNLDLSADEHDCQQGWSMWICTKTNPAPMSETIAKAITAATNNEPCHYIGCIRTDLSLTDHDREENINKEENTVDLPKAKASQQLFRLHNPRTLPSSISLRYDCIT